MTSFTAAFAKGTALSGSASFPVHCTGPENCVLQFDVRTDDGLARPAESAAQSQLLQSALVSPAGDRTSARRRVDEVARQRAHFHARVSSSARSIANNVNGSLELRSGKLRVHELRADILGGHQNGSWIADFTVSPPRFMGNGIVSKLSMTQLAALMHDNWATGTVDAEYSLTLAGTERRQACATPPAAPPTSPGPAARCAT